MIKRNITPKIKELSHKYPVILLVGPRQSGKTTLVKSTFKKHIYRNLENPDEKLLAKEDPRSFLEIGSGKKIIIDEIQEVPEIASYIQNEVDEQKQMSQFVLTGYQNFQISQTVTQSFAGRVANFELLPLSYNELVGEFEIKDLNKFILGGGYPGKYTKNIDSVDFYRDYISTYVSRDVRSLKNIGDLTNFQRFMNLLAGRVGQIVNMTSLANDVGVSVKTIDSWITVLEASYIVYRLQPYYENFGKRVIKSPKVYFYDTGLLSFLLGINSSKELKLHYAYGQIFENLIISEITKQIFNKRLNEKLYFWRDSNGNEVDLIIDKGLDKVALEIKSGRTFSKSMIKGLNYLHTFFAQKYNLETKVVYAGNQEQKIGDHEIVNWENFLD
ncbi:DUF4143 domain-containing protein [Candidatus Dojkabacteria bacterium]|nr:DUF4143 domain-containing protein [Candidatus Dojkabacteria bacterium]